MVFLGVQAQAATSLKTVAAALITGARSTNEYTGTAAGYNECSASLQVLNGELIGSVSYGDTGASVRAPLGSTAVLGNLAGVTTVKFDSTVNDDDIELTVKNKSVTKIVIASRDTILFIPHTTYIECADLVQFTPTY